MKIVMNIKLLFWCNKPYFQGEQINSRKQTQHVSTHNSCRPVLQGESKSCGESKLKDVLFCLENVSVHLNQRERLPEASMLRIVHRWFSGRLHITSVSKPNPSVLPGSPVLQTTLIAILYLQHRHAISFLGKELGK